MSMRNKKRKTRRFGEMMIRSTAVLLAGICLFGCQNSQEGKEDTVTAPVKIPITFIVDSSTGKKNEEKVVEEFNEAYKGVCEADVEWIMETENDYRQNLKRQNVTDKLPAVITDLRMLPSFYQMMITEKRIEDLSPYIYGDEEWKNLIEPVVLEGCSEPDGKIYLAPLSTAAFSCSGIFWNEELFARAGIQEFPETWEEFWECCDQLMAQGITPLALHTDGTAWAPMLLATAELADTREGMEFMKELYPESYQNENGLHLAETLQRLFLYTTEDAIHNDFDVAYNNFFSGGAAMIPNGYWMMDQIPDGWKEKVRFSAFPGNKLISSPETFGWSLVSAYGEDVKEAVLAFFKFRTALNKQEKDELFSRSMAQLSSTAEGDYIRAYQNEPQIVPNYQVKWNSIFQEEVLGQTLPELISGKISANEFVQMADESIRQFREEQ